MSQDRIVGFAECPPENSILSDPIRWDEPQVGVYRSNPLEAFLNAKTRHQRDRSEGSSARPTQV